MPSASVPQAVQSCHELLLWLIPQLDKFLRVRRFTSGEQIKMRSRESVRAEPVEARASPGARPIGTSKTRDWLICVWRRAADVFMKDAGYQALIGQAFFGGAPLEHVKVGGR